jgi:hypothetical protein
MKEGIWYFFLGLLIIALGFLIGVPVFLVIGGFFVVFSFWDSFDKKRKK